MIDALRQDLAYAFRGIRARPGFAIAVAGTLALGLGANAAMFSLVDRMLFRPPPMLKDPATAHRVYVYSTFRGQERAGGVSMYARYRDLTEGTTASFSSTAGYTQRDIAVGTGEDSREMSIGVVSATFFGFFDALPAAGRYFTTAEDSVSSPADVAVISWPMWQTRFGGRKEALNSTIQIGPTRFTIIGVAPKGFVGLWPERPPVAYIPITNYGSVQARGLAPFLQQRHQTWWETYNWGWMSMMARRKPDVTIAAANSDLTGAALKSYQKQLAANPRSQPIGIAKPRATAGSILAERGPNESPVAKVATWLAGVALVVLLIACANVANLLLTRAFRRRREIAVRLALGVSRARLLTQLLTESILLALMGGLAGMIVGQWLSGVLSATFGAKDSTPPSVVADPRTLWFAAVAALVTGILAGLAPVWQARKADLAGDLKAGMREGTYQRSKARTALLVTQGALSVLLLVGAGLFVRSLDNVKSVRLGYDPDAVLLVNPNFRGVELDSAAQLALRQRLFDAAKAVPGVSHVSLQNAVPFWSMTSFSLFVDGIDSTSRLGNFQLNRVSADYFATMGTQVLKGRALSDADVATAPRVTVVSEAMAKALWPGQDPLGKCIRINADTMPCTTVVGVAENIHATRLGADSTFYYYLPAAQSAPQQGGLFVRVGGAGSGSQDRTAAMIEPLRKALQKEMPGASYITVTPFSDVLGDAMKSFSLGATMFAAFGLLALAVAAVGLYSVIAYNVAQRTHEMGVRVALGAQMGDLVRLVVGEGARFGLSGVVVGCAIALGAGRWVKPLLFDESPRDPAVFGGVALTLMIVALAASWMPAMRAARVNPNEALRAD